MHASKAYALLTNPHPLGTPWHVKLDLIVQEYRCLARSEILNAGLFGSRRRGPPIAIAIAMAHWHATGHERGNVLAQRTSSRWQKRQQATAPESHHRVSVV
jgi:hypothetical protein